MKERKFKTVLKEAMGDDASNSLVDCLTLAIDQEDNKICRAQAKELGAAGDDEREGPKLMSLSATSTIVNMAIEDSDMTVEDAREACGEMYGDKTLFDKD